MKSSVIVLVVLSIAGIAVLGILLKNKKKIPARKTIQMNKAAIEKILNVKVDEFPAEGVLKASFPRNDIPLKIQGYSIDPFMGLTTWVAFQSGEKPGVEAMIMGDIVLLEHEVPSAMDAALKNEIHITALHNHFFYDEPKIYFMHISGEGATEELSIHIKNMLDAIKNAKKITPQLSAENNINGSIIEKILGVQGQAKNGMFKIIIGRTTHAECGCAVGKNMGINTWAAFGGTQDNAIVDGDFVVLENELQSVLKALRTANIAIVAIHNHMIQENPRLIFLHFWGNGKLIDLAQHLKNALNQTSTLKK